MAKHRAVHLPEKDLSPFQGDYGAVWVNSVFLEKNKYRKGDFVTISHSRGGKPYTITRILRTRSVQGLDANTIGLWADDLQDLRFNSSKDESVDVVKEPKLRGLWLYFKSHPSPVIRIQAWINFALASLSIVLGILSIGLGILSVILAVIALK